MFGADISFDGRIFNRLFSKSTTGVTCILIANKLASAFASVKETVQSAFRSPAFALAV